MGTCSCRRTNPEAAKVRYLHELARRRGVAVVDSLEAAVGAAIEMVGQGVARTGGECCVPASVFRTPALQSWYGAQRGAGNELRDARVEWVLRTGGSSFSGEIDPLAVAVDEVWEEAGLRLSPSRLAPLGARQLAATLLSHRAHAFVAELTQAELEALPLDRVLRAVL
jgi:hypothetical protein